MSNIQAPEAELRRTKKVHVELTVNGEPREFLCAPRQSLLEVLRDQLDLTGAKEGCNNGNCGACAVLLDGVPVNSCLVLAVETEGAEVETVEGLADGAELHPLQQCFLEVRPCSVAFARPAFWFRPKRCWTEYPTPAKRRSGSIWLATSAAARATTKSSAPSETRRRQKSRQPTKVPRRFTTESRRTRRETQSHRVGWALPTP